MKSFDQRQVLSCLHKHIVGSKSLVILYTNPASSLVTGSPPSHLKQGLPRSEFSQNVAETAGESKCPEHRWDLILPGQNSKGSVSLAAEN